MLELLLVCLHGFMYTLSTSEHVYVRAHVYAQTNVWESVPWRRSFAFCNQPLGSCSCGGPLTLQNQQT